MNELGYKDAMCKICATYGFYALKDDDGEFNWVCPKCGEWYCMTLEERNYFNFLEYKLHGGKRRKADIADAISSRIKEIKEAKKL